MHRRLNYIIHNYMHTYTHSYIHSEFFATMPHISSPYPSPIKLDFVARVKLYTSSILFRYALITSDWKPVRQRSRIFSFTYTKTSLSGQSQGGTLAILKRFEMHIFLMPGFDNLKIPMCYTY